MSRTSEARTALAFVSLKADGERDFMFYRHPSADMLWKANERDRAIATTGRIFHYGSISLISEPSRTSTILPIEAAHDAGAVISYDPNLRLPLWPSTDAAREGMLLGLSFADVVKMSRDEIVFLSGSEEVTAGARRIWQDRMRLLAVTDGADGCWWFTAVDSGQLDGFPVKSVDTTGAGDAFVAGMLTGLLEQKFQMDAAALQWILRLANAAGALTVTRRGAIPSLPTRAELDDFLSTIP